MTTVPAAAVPRLREALYRQIGTTAEEIDQIILWAGRAHDDWSALVARFDRARVVLDVIGWNDRTRERDTEIDLDQHREVIVEALRDELDAERYLMSDKGAAQRSGSASRPALTHALSKRGPRASD